MAISNLTFQSAKKIVQEFEGFQNIGDKQKELSEHVLNCIQDMDVDNMDDEEVNSKISELRKMVEQKWLTQAA